MKLKIENLQEFRQTQKIQVNPLGQLNPKKRNSNLDFKVIQRKFLNSLLFSNNFYVTHNEYVCQ